MDSRLEKQVEPTGLVGCGKIKGGQESRMRCPALSKWVDTMLFTEMGNRRGCPGLRVEDEDSLGHVSLSVLRTSEQRCPSGEWVGGSGTQERGVGWR